MEQNEDIRRSDAEDLAWIRVIKEGNTRVFEKLLGKYRKRIYYTVRRIVLDHDDTDDAVQEAFVKAYMHLDGFDESCPFYPWLQKIAVNTALNHLSRIKRRREVHMENASAAGASETSGPFDDPLEQVFQNDLKAGLERALDSLPAEQRAIFILRTSDGLSYSEIAEQLGISPGTVMSRLSRAREKLKVFLKPYLADEQAGRSGHGL